MARKPAVRKQYNERVPMPTLSPAMTRVTTVVAVLMLVVGTVLWFRAWIGNPEHLRIQKVEWQGDFQYLKRADLDTLAAPYLETNLFLLDADDLELALEAHDWVRGVSLRKVWPSQLIVEVETQFPIAFWGNDQLLNKFGEIFPGSLPEKQGVFPQIYSPLDNGREMAERYVKLMQSLQGLGLEIVELTEDERGSWQMKLRQGPEVIIGRKEQEKRVQRFKVGYSRGLRERFADIDRIDLRYTNGFAVEWKQGTGGEQLGASGLDAYAQRILGS